MKLRNPIVVGRPEPQPATPLPPLRYRLAVGVLVGATTFMVTLVAQRAWP